MTTNFLEAGTGATFGTQFFSSTSGTVSSDSGTVHTGIRSLKLASTYATAKRDGILSDAGFRCSVYFNTSSWPSDHTEGPGILSFAAAGGTPFVMNFRIDESTGVLKAYYQGSGIPVPGGAGTTSVSTGTWHRLSVAAVITSKTVNDFKVWLDGVLEITIHNLVEIDSTGADQFILGAGSGVTTYFSDIFVDNGSSLTDPGDIRVTAKRPASNNVNQFTTNIGANPANRWTNVNERALSETNGWLDAVNADRENYGIEAQSAGDVDLTGVTLLDRCAWIWAKATTGGLGSPKITNNGTDTAITLLSTSSLFTNIVTSGTYPSASDTIGMVSAGTLDTTSFYECGMLIAYTPASAAGTTYPQLERGRRGINRGILIGTS